MGLVMGGAGAGTAAGAGAGVIAGGGPSERPVDEPGCCEVLGWAEGVPCEREAPGCAGFLAGPGPMGGGGLDGCGDGGWAAAVSVEP